MARNEEKQQGRLNRLWLQKEREEGRLKDVHEKRPRLSSLNSASSVKKWIPSIKKDIEYYLQQSQLSHYPERKIAEFHLQIETLEKEYKSFVSKLRVLDPSCKHKPWTPRAYCKRRADPQDSLKDEKIPRCTESGDGSSSQQSGSESDFTSSRFRSLQSSLAEGPPTFSHTQSEAPLSSETSPRVCADQDQPLSFDQTRLAVAAAAFRGPSVQTISSQTQKLARLLQSGLPNLSNSQSRQTLQERDAKNSEVSAQRPAAGHNTSHNSKDTERISGKLSSNGIAEERTGHVLGLDCYSSSDEDCDT
ncbi:uncharacterized protein LOC115382308 [Salarias fasciatus]|uniref:uncharacterized protein LOC115382308 n=1 Tax=Salarias fasciatus TaxID=181472 RepID=UPI0011765064|nr:uncharacterized protein LOC115382308 [Salarias fasciatus]